jgi:hypothetical protein
VLSLLASILLAPPAAAADYDPDLRWRTLATEHFRITFHDGEAQLADEMAIAAERAWTQMTAEIGTAPKEPVELVLVDWTDSANGYATVIPRNTIVIFVTAPNEDSTLGFYEDWNSAIVTHELTHVLHIDTVEGLPRVARFLMGSIISTHQLSPGWIVEGFATYEETRFTAAGRGRSAAVDMVKRAAVLEDAFPALGNMDGFQALPPAGNLRYLFGQDFIQYVADTTGSEKWTEWVHTYGASIPFLLPTRRTFGDTFTRLYEGWRAELERRYRAQEAAIVADGLTRPTPISPDGNPCGAPAWSPDGERIAYACSDPRRGSALWSSRADGSERKKLVDDTFVRNVAWRSDGRAVAYSKSHVVDLYSVYDDVYLYDLDKKRARALTSGARARDPSFSADGSRMLVVTNGAQDNQLAVLTVDQQLRPLTANTDHTQYGTPRYSPDGRWIAVSMWRDGLRDLWLLHPDGTPARRLTMDAAIDREPAWSTDGRTLFFTSDRSGVPNVYALDLDAERLWRVTNVVTGAWAPAPSPDGSTLALNHFQTSGARVATLPLDRAAWRDLGPLPLLAGEPQDALSSDATDAPAEVHPPIPSAPAVRPADADPTADADTPAEAPRVTPYKPLRTLLPPRFWLPGTYLTTTGQSLGLFATAATYGADTLGFLSYSAYATYRTDARFLGGGGSFTVNRWRPVVSVGASTSVTPFGDVLRSTGAPPEGGATLPGLESTLTRYWDRRVRAFVGVGYPLTERSAVSGSYSGTLRSSLDPLPADAALSTVPTRGFFSTLAGGWRWSKGSATTLSISPEDARAVAFGAELTPAFLGSWTYDDAGARVPFNQAQATVEWREYRAVPFLPNHVVALKLSGGGTIGDRFKFGSFRLGGDFSESGITVVPGEWRMLRGFYPASDDGQWYWLGSGEYRFPIARIDRGVGTLPAFLRSVSGAVLIDAGNAFDDPAGLALPETLVGTGAELRVDGIVGWGAGLYGRLGYAFGLNGPGKPLGSPAGLYAVLGSSF